MKKVIQELVTVVLAPGSTIAGAGTMTDGINDIENIVGSPDDDILVGDEGNNVIEGGDGEDMLDGGANTDFGDTVSYRSSSRSVKIDLSDDPADIGSRGDAAGDTIYNFENVTGSAHDDDLRGTVGGANTITGLAGEDVLDGGDEDTNGTQQLFQLNRLISTNGADTVSYYGSSAGVTVNLATASVSGGDATGDEIETFDVDYDHDGDTVVDNDENSQTGTTVTNEAGDTVDGADEDSDTDPVEAEFSTFENIYGSAHRDVLTGDDRMNTIWGDAGDDVIKGGRSSDTLEGGAGADTLDGGHTRTSNTEPGDRYMDTASYSRAQTGVTVDLDAGRGTAGDAMGDRFVSIEKFEGSSNDDMFIAGEDT